MPRNLGVSHAIGGEYMILLSFGHDEITLLLDPRFRKDACQLVFTLAFSTIKNIFKCCVKSYYFVAKQHVS